MLLNYHREATDKSPEEPHSNTAHKRALISYSVCRKHTQARNPKCTHGTTSAFTHTNAMGTHTHTRARTYGTHSRTHPHTRARARARAHTHTHTHTHSDRRFILETETRITPTSCKVCLLSVGRCPGICWSWPYNTAAVG